MDAIADLIWGGACALLEPGEASGAELHSKFIQEGAAFTMSYGGLDTFWGGLEALIGAPNPRLDQAIEREHCHSADWNVCLRRPIMAHRPRPRLSSGL